MADKDSTATQKEQEKLLEEALKQPGVADAAETYGRLGQYAPMVPQPLVHSGYAVGGNS